MTQLFGSPPSSPALSHSAYIMGSSQESLSLSATDTSVMPKSPIHTRNLKKSDRFFLNDNMIEFLVRHLVYQVLSTSIDVHSQVEDTQYRVPRYYFDQYSEDFAAKYNFSAKTCFDATPYIHLDDVKTRDFDQLLSIFYPR
jgi:hypothetical protein